MLRLSTIRAGWIVLGFVIATGCAGGPLGLAKYNPVLRDEWEKDEKYGHTMHHRMEEMQDWAHRGKTMPAEEQRQVATQLNKLIQEEANNVVVLQAVRTLGALTIPEAAEGLQQAARHASPDVRVVACEAWRHRGGPEAREQLTQIVNSDTDVDVRVSAARQLAYFRDTDSIRALGIALDDPNPALQFRAVESLKVITGQNYGDNVVAWREFVAGGQAKPGPGPSWAARMVGWTN